MALFINTQKLQNANASGKNINEDIEKWSKIEHINQLKAILLIN